MSRPEDTKHGRCQATAKSTGEQCGRAAVAEHGKCDVHGGKTPTKDENPDVGNGEQDGNGNAITHGATADPWNLDANLGDEGRAWVDAKVEAYLNRDDAEADGPNDDLAKLGVLHLYQAYSAHSELAKEGLSRTSIVGTTEHGAVTDEEAHYLNSVASGHTRDYRMAMKDAGLLDDPASQQADATESIAEILATANEGGD